MSILHAYMVPHPPLIIPEVGKGRQDGIPATVAAYKEVGRQIADAQPDTIIVSTPHSVMYYDYFHISPGDESIGNFVKYGVPSSDWSMSVKYDTEFVQKLCDYADELSFPAGVAGERDAALDHATLIPLHFVREALVESLQEEHSSNSLDGIRTDKSNANERVQDSVERDLVQLPKMVRIGLSGLPLSYHYMLGMLIQKAAEELDRNVVYIASGDLSHKLLEEGPYGFDANGPVYDDRIMDVMGRGAFGELFDFETDFCERAAECGHRSFVMMAGALDRCAVDAKALSHDGPFGVGYGICTFDVVGEDNSRNFLEQAEAAKAVKMQAVREREDVYVGLARWTLEHYLTEGYVRDPKVYFEQVLSEDSPSSPTDPFNSSDSANANENISNSVKELQTRRAGAFVSLHKEGALRGCIGTTGPTQDSLAEEIQRNAVSAATQDPRFPKVEAYELNDLVYNVDVLSEPENIESVDQLDVKKYGVIVYTDGIVPKRGLLLPDLAGVDTVDEQVRIARQKANIADDEEFFLQRFTVERHSV